MWDYCQASRLLFKYFVTKIGKGVLSVLTLGGPKSNMPNSWTISASILKTSIIFFRWWVIVILISYHNKKWQKWSVSFFLVTNCDVKWVLIKSRHRRSNQTDTRGGSSDYQGRRISYQTRAWFFVSLFQVIWGSRLCKYRKLNKKYQKKTFRFFL